MSPASLTDTDSPLRPVSKPAFKQHGTVAELEVQLARHLARSRRQGDQLALLWIEVDLLTTVAPANASTPRDEVAQALRARLQHRVRRNDQIFQVGHQHFAVLLDTDPAGARLVEQRLVTHLRGPYGMDGWMMYVQLGIGQASLPESAQRGSGLLRCAMADLEARRAQGNPTGLSRTLQPATAP